MILEKTDSMFDSRAQALVNPVNCVGVMGGGLAKAFATIYPEMNKDYVNWCIKGTLRPGKIHTYVDTLNNAPIIFNFPTKDHWKHPSKLEYIESGMRELAFCVQDLDVRTIAIPALGCGLGGLDWAEVKPIIEKYANWHYDRDWMLYPPQQGEL